MAEGNRLLICVLAVVIVCGIAAGLALDWNGRQGAAGYTALATTALGVLCPSPLRQAERAAVVEAACPAAPPKGYPEGGGHAPSGG